MRFSLAIKPAPLCLFVVSLMLMLAGAEAAEAYKCKGKNGETVYSDTPCANNAELVPLRDAQGYSPVPVTSPAASTAGPASGKPKAVKLAVVISSPSDGQVFNDNEGKVSIAANVTPELPDGFKLHLMMDGTELTSGELSNVDRGEHAVNATVSDEKGHTVASSKIIHFVMQKKSALHSVMINPYTDPKNRPKKDDQH